MDVVRSLQDSLHKYCNECGLACVDGTLLLLCIFEDPEVQQFLSQNGVLNPAQKVNAYKKAVLDWAQGPEGLREDFNGSGRPTGPLAGVFDKLRGAHCLSMVDALTFLASDNGFRIHFSKMYNPALSKMGIDFSSERLNSWGRFGVRQMECSMESANFNFLQIG